MFLENIHPTWTYLWGWEATSANQVTVPSMIRCFAEWWLFCGEKFSWPTFSGILGSIIFKPWNTKARGCLKFPIDDQHNQLQTKMIRWLRLDQQNLEGSLRDPSGQPDSSKQPTYNRITQKQGAPHESPT